MRMLNSRIPYEESVGSSSAEDTGVRRPLILEENHQSSAGTNQTP